MLPTRRVVQPPGILRVAPDGTEIVCNTTATGASDRIMQARARADLHRASR